MNKYDDYFNFRIATEKDVDDIMKFIREEYSDTHILGNDREFFCWMYGNSEYSDNDTINFVLMLDKMNHIVGLNGFVAYAREPDKIYVSSALTKVKNDLKIPLCGVELIKRFKQLVPAKAYYSSGTNPHTMLPLGKRIFKYDTGMMSHYYIVNRRMRDYKIAIIHESDAGNYLEEPYFLKTVSDINELFFKFNLEKRYKYQAYKSREYIGKRYFKHPIYKYHSLAVLKQGFDDIFEGVLFGREIEVNGARVFRIVDYLGEISSLGKIGVAIREFMFYHNYEYVDLLTTKLPDEIVEHAGFSVRTDQDDNVIPMYFEPFIQENIDIYYQRSDPEIMIFKADGDQDRPNAAKRRII